MPPHPDRPAYFLDFDGCLVDLAPHPDAIRVPRGVVATLARLHAQSGGALALISGRPLADLMRFLPGLTVPMVGSHGAERRWGRRVARLRVDQDVLAKARARLQAVAAKHPGYFVEIKPVAVGLHYGADLTLASHAAETMAEIAAEASGFHLHPSKNMIELRPDGIGKDSGLRALMSDLPFRGRVPVVMGDDLTDEPAFQIANARGGVSVKVGPGTSAARHRLASPALVRETLAVWAFGGGRR